MGLLALQVVAFSVYGCVVLDQIQCAKLLFVFIWCWLVHLQTSGAFIAASPLFSAQQGRLARSNDEDLKRLGFLQSYSGFCLSKSYGMASSVYNTSLAYTPARLNSSVRAMEGAISDYTVPMVTAVQNSSWRALHQLDHQVRLPATPLLAIIDSAGFSLAAKLSMSAFRWMAQL